jgi:hypothetical protein
VLTQPPTVPALISLSLLTVISNITAAEFNETAFKAAVLDAIKVAAPTAVLAVQVIIRSTPQAITKIAALNGDSYHRHLQATDSSVTVAYDITNLPDAATAAVMQKQLSSLESNAIMLNSYETLDNSTAATAMTTTVSAPNKPPDRKQSPVGAIVGAAAGAVALAMLCIAWRKRDAITRCMLKERNDGDRETAIGTTGSNIDPELGSGNMGHSTTTTGNSMHVNEGSEQAPAYGSTTRTEEFRVSGTDNSDNIAAQTEDVVNSTWTDTDTAEAVLGLVGVVADNLPYTKAAYTILDEIVQLFQAKAHASSNCAEVVSWARDMQVQQYVIRVALTYIQILLISTL